MTNAAQFALTDGTKVAGFGSGCANESRALLFGEQNMTERAQIQVPQKESDVYASREDFHTIFNEDLKQLSTVVSTSARHRKGGAMPGSWARRVCQGKPRFS